MRKLQTGLQFIYPTQCAACDAQVLSVGGLCGRCLREMPFLRGAGCARCAVPLPGAGYDELAICDACLIAPPPWQNAYAACLYEAKARQMVLAFKHADRTELALPMARWMAKAIGPDVENACIVPIPLHWMRRLKRGYNQAALLADELGRITGRPVLHDMLFRTRRTRMMAHFTAADRQAAQDGSIGCAHPIKRPVILVDDVMTTGATFRAATSALKMKGAVNISTLSFARVAKLQ